MRRLHCLLAAALMLPVLALAEAGDDPLGSPAWLDLKPSFVGNARVVFDDRVKVSGPKIAEDSLNVPVGVRIEGLPDIERVLVVADLNPITKVLEFSPKGALPALYFRMKLQQASPIRALALTKDGIWHAGGIWIDAAGGGCTAPSTGRSNANWTATLNTVQAQAWENDQQSRLKLKIMHPMDTGLAPGIPAFYIEKLSLRDARGHEWMMLKTFEPVSENPVFSFDFVGRTPPGLVLSGHDNNGNLIHAKVAK
ncbi:MAG: quinoprotein dehydrogenase-associated SoxYZ-like carrier [Rugosibacter sp.]|nr:quinoprotein dehydrogenase-associated SoxYZ-like carrier [Rugosibacter sp.]